MPAEVDQPEPDFGDPSRRTWLAAERTWLAWWRTALGAAAVSLGVGRVLPDITHGTRWPYVLLGAGYGLLAIAVVVAGALRQQRTAEALRRGSYSEMSSALVLGLTGGALLLALGTLILVLVKL
jgi:putative membrane protein